MEILRYKYIFITIILLINGIRNEETKSDVTTTTPKCIFTKIIEDVFKTNNKTTETDTQARGTNRDRVKLYLNAIANITNENVSRKEEDLINVIIASINRIKNNVSSVPDEFNEAVILNPNSTKKINELGSGFEEKTNGTRIKKQTTKSVEKAQDSPTTEAPKYVEILTIPHAKENTTSAHILEVLKHLMPLFNSTLSKEVHNITFIESGTNKSSFSAAKNVSTIIVTYCNKDKDNLAKTDSNLSSSDDEHQDEYDPDEDYFLDDENQGSESEDGEELNISLGEKREIMEAAEYGMQKMHELYTVLEPKLYSMGLWLDDTSPARYVAAFNAPSEEAAKFSRYGYATLQAAAKLKQLTREVLKHDINVVAPMFSNTDAVPQIL